MSEHDEKCERIDMTGNGSMIVDRLLDDEILEEIRQRTMAIELYGKDFVERQESTEAWVDRVAVGAQERRTSCPNWDFENGPAIPASDWRAARQLCKAVVLAVPRAPIPVPAPCGDGTIHLRWSSGKTDVVIELKDHHTWWTRKGPDGRQDGEFSDPRNAVALLRETFA